MTGLEPRKWSWFRDALLMMSIITAVSWFQITHCERIPISDGLGYDGRLYGEQAASFDISHFRGSVDSYSLQRIVPSALVATALKALGVARTMPHIIRGFQVLTWLELLLSVVCWCSTASTLKFRRGVTWLGFILLFCNFAIAKQAFYYPVSTDVSAFLLGGALCQAFVARRPLRLLAVAVIGSFAWPICSIAGAALLLAPRQLTAKPETKPRYASALAVVITLGLLGIGLVARFVLHKRIVGGGPVVPVIDALLPLSVLTHGAILCAALYPLTANLTVRYVRDTAQQLGLRGWLLLVSCLVLPKLLIALFANHEPPRLTMQGFLGMISLLPLTRPAVTWVAHTAYFGLALPLLMLRWRSISALVRQQGTGALAFAGLTLLIGLTPESRQSLLSYPALVLMVCCSVRELPWTSPVLLGLAALDIVAARVWLPLNADYRPGADALNELPAYFYSQGPYMTTPAYLVFLGTGVVLTMITWLLLRKLQQSDTISA